MVEKTTIGISALITLGIVIASMVGPSFFDTPKYYCEDRPEVGVVSCDAFSKYVAENGKCIRNEDTNLICREGWIEVTEDRGLPEEVEEPISDDIILGSGGIQYRCDQSECVRIK